MDNKFLLFILGSVLSFSISYAIHWYSQEPVVITSMEVVDNVVDYSRDVRRSFDGVWSVIITSRESVVCRGSGYSFYEVGNIEMELSIPDYTGDPECDLPAGEYEMYTEWIPDEESLGRSFHVHRFQIEE